MPKQENKSFCALIRDIVTSENFRKMQDYKQHIHGNTYAHSVKVAYLCYQHYHRHKSKVNLKELIRGALLHDYFLYDLHDQNAPDRVNGLVHGFTHPKRALANAMKDFPDLTRTERDIIRRHMFPLTPIPPKTRGGWLVCYYDKLAALQDYFSIRRAKKLHR